MKELKLEVGKTYRSREGREVRIVKMIDPDIWPFCGDNDESYNEHGRYYSDSSNDPRDLIEEVEELSETRHTFDIPDGVKKVTVEQVGNKIVVEMVPEKEPNPGDVMINDKGSVYIFKSVEGNHSHNHYAWLGESGRLSIAEQCIYTWLGGSGLLFIGGSCYPGRLATPEEAKSLFDALKKAGKRWNAETMQVEEVSERERILEWSEHHLSYGHHTKEGIVEAIEAYLKYREGEK